MKKSILFSVLVVGATLLQAQSITVHQTCGQNGQVIKAIPDAIDLGLSVNWADMNVGAKYIEDYGRSTIMKVAKPFLIRKMMLLTSIGAIVGECQPRQNGRN